MGTTKICIICKKCDGRLIILSKKAKDTLIRSSEARKDGRDEEFSNTSPADNFLSDAMSVVPKTLNCFMEGKDVERILIILIHMTQGDKKSLTL